MHIQFQFQYGQSYFFSLFFNESFWKMMFLSVFILALIYQDVNSTPVLTEEERSFWSAYAHLFPRDMGGVVRSESSLVQIHWHTSLTKNYDLDAIMLGCSNYSSGDALGMILRTDCVMIIFLFSRHY